jgi:hypothetical protein
VGSNPTQGTCGMRALTIQDCQRRIIMYNADVRRRAADLM